MCGQSFTARTLNPMPRIVFLTPPLIKPSEPGLSAAAAAQWFHRRGVDASALDASIGWYRHVLKPEHLSAALPQAEAQGYARGTLQAFRQSMRDISVPVHPLQRPEVYGQRHVYSSAVSHLVNALRLASVPHPGFHLRVADVEVEGRRPHNSEDLEAVATASTPFDRYFLEELLPWIKAERFTHVAVSLTFLHQAYAAFRLAFLLQQHLPGIQRLLGGPLVACWSAVGASLETPGFKLFHRVFATTSEPEMDALVMELGGTPSADNDVLAPDLKSTAWDSYLVPQPTVPVALGRGCYWRRCTFCPDYLHPKYKACRPDALGNWLEGVAGRFPAGAMLHLTDSALSPALLSRVAEVVRSRRLPLRWHGFVRLERRYEDPDFMQQLAEGGCAMLQWGLETASPRLLELMEKGITPEQARAVLRSSAQAGIRNHAYLLFGLPTETDDDRECTLTFIQEESERLQDLNASILNLPRRSPMHDHPGRYGITALSPFGKETDLSLYDDFRCGDRHPRLEARHWLAGRFSKDPAVKRILGDLNAPFKANHGCFLPRQ
jgi:hypothetical protein